MRIVENGNLSFGVRTMLVVLGGAIGVVSFIWIRSILLMSAGLFIAAVGGYASKAHQLGIKPFDNSYKKARDSYKVENDEQETKR